MIAALTMRALGWALANWKLVAVGAFVVGLYAYHKIEVNRSWHAGQAALRAEQAAEAKRRDADAKAADDAVRECARDPACLLRSDGFRRD